MLSIPDSHDRIDLLVVKEEIIQRWREILNIKRALKGIPLSLNIVVVTHSEFRDYKMMHGSLIHRIDKNGVLLYEG